MKILFLIITVIGIFIFMAWMTGSHGHLIFRSNQTEDWVAFGTPIIGIIGFLLSFFSK